MPKIYKRNCNYCGNYYIGKNAPKFCSCKCSTSFNSKNKKIGFKKGNKSWLKGTKGVAKINSGSFQKGQFSGEKHWNWKGGVSTYHIKKSGYIQKRIGKHRYYIHRLIMEEYLGRKLKRSEHVHHINHKRSDNRIENLMLMNPSEHFSYHAKKQWKEGNFGRHNYF